MRRFFVVLVFLLMVQGANLISEAQMEVSCATQMYVPDDVNIEPFDYTYACDTDDCYSEDYLLCHFQWGIQRLEQCETDDLFCRNEAQLIIVGQYMRGDANFGFFLPRFFGDDFPQVITAFSAGDFETALILLQDPAYDDYFPYPLILYSRGLIYEMLNQPDEALREYSRALDIMPNHTLIHYIRGLLYARLGRTTEASFETAWIEDYLTAFAPSLLPFVTPLTEAYPLDISRFSTWIKYPVMINSVNPGGFSYWDRTQLAGTPVQIAIYDELGVMLALDVAELRYPRSTGDILNTYVLQALDDGSYVYEFPKWEVFNPDTLTLELRDGLYWALEYKSLGEGSVEAEFILAPSDYLDPRHSFGEPVCEGGVISRLRPGMYVSETGFVIGFHYAETPGGILDPNRYFDDGNRGDQTDENYSWLEVRVTDNFTCLGDELWWEVTDGLGNTGWRAENLDMEYQINPQNDLRGLFYCLNAPRMRLYIRAEGRVLTGLGANNLRTEPNPDAERVEILPEGGQFTVLDGPVCMNGMAWWQIDYNGTVGWTAEGNNESYWIEPVLPR